MNYNEVTLEKLQFGISTRLSDELLCGTKVEVTYDYLVNHIVLTVKGFVWGENAQREEIKYPCDWWQMFKKQYFPSWALSKWPVEYTRIVVDVKAIYPNFRPAMPYEDMVLVIQDKVYATI